MADNCKVLTIYQNKAKKTDSNFKYPISSILKNLCEAFNSSLITAKEKLEIKNLIFSKSRVISDIMEELNNRKLFRAHLKTLKKTIKRKQETEKKASRKKVFPSLNIFSINDSSNEKYFNENSREPLNSLY